MRGGDGGERVAQGGAGQPESGRLHLGCDVEAEMRLVRREIARGDRPAHDPHTRVPRDLQEPLRAPPREVGDAALRPLAAGTLEDLRSARLPGRLGAAAPRQNAREREGRAQAHVGDGHDRPGVHPDARRLNAVAPLGQGIAGARL